MQAQLITPEGKAIALPEHVYFQPLELLEMERASTPMPKEELEQLIQETKGSLKGRRRPLTEVLLESRREELEREERGIRERQKRRAARVKV
ncbi:MAG: hypothetical protein HY327_05165 [Chloroflexi bacterium]|nr:hypothetical protein [Chloroflexota bacterium]